MALCSFSRDYLTMGVTPVENVFIEHYMNRAPGDYVRVYLYGLMQCYRPADEMSLTKMATVLNLPLNVVEEAFQYWERRGLVRRLSDREQAYEYLNVTATLSEEAPQEKDVYRYRDVNDRLQQIFGGRLLHPAEFSKASEWIEDLHIPEDVVLTAIGEMAKGREKSLKFDACDKVMLTLAEKGITNPADVRALVESETAPGKLAKKLTTRLGLRRSPTEDEIAMTRKWLEEWRLTQDAVLEACKATTRGRNPTFAYLDSILSDNRAAHTGEDMAASMQKTEQLRSAVKAIHEALGHISAGVTEKELTAYQEFIAAGFEPEAVLRVAKNMSGGRYSMDDLAQQLTSFAQRGLLTDMQVAEYLDQQKLLRAQASRVYEISGQESRINAAAAAQMEGWLALAPFPVVLYAAECARGTQNPGQYMTRLLQIWQGEGVTTVEQAKQRSASRPAAAHQATAAPQFEQRSYTPEQYADFTVDLTQYVQPNQQEEDSHDPQ